MTTIFAFRWCKAAELDIAEHDKLSKLHKKCCRLPQLLEGNMPGYSLAATRYDEDARKIGCARRVVGTLSHMFC